MLGVCIGRMAVMVFVCSLSVSVQAAEEPDRGLHEGYDIHPIGWVRKTAGRTVIEIEERYRPMGWIS